MKKTLTAIGNSLGIIIDKPILELLEIDKDTLLEVKTDGDGLIIRPIRDEAAASPSEPRRETAPPPPSPPQAEPPPSSGDASGLLDELDELDELDDGPSAPPAAKPPPPPPAAKPPPRAEAPGPTSAEGQAAYSGTPEIVITRKGDEVMRIPFDGVEKVIGREATADVHLDDRALSRKHAKVEKRGAAIWVSDLGSANGTYVNGEKLEAPRRLHQGDVVSVGHFKICVEGTAAASEKMPVLTLTGPEGTHRFAMVGEHIVIGRSQSCDISIGHKSISRRHVRLGVEDDGFFVEDLGSQNGCKLNGKQLKGTAPLVPGDRIDICDFSVELGYLDDPAASQEGGKPKPGGPGRPSTMLIDKSAMAQAAYVDGDFENVRSRVLNKSASTSGKGAKLETGDYDLPQTGAAKKARKKKKRSSKSSK